MAAAFRQSVTGLLLAVPLLFAIGEAQAQPVTPPAASGAKSVPPVIVKLYTDDVVVAADGLTTHTVHLEEQATNQVAAQRMGQIPVPFSDSMEEIEITEAYTLKADGRKLPVSPAAIYTQLPQGAPQVPMFDDRRQKVIVFPDVAANDTIVYTCIRRDKQALLPGQMFMSMVFSRQLAFDEARITVVAPKTLPLATETHDVDFSKEDTGATLTYHWHYAAPDPMPPDNAVLSAFDRSPRFLVSTLKNYDDFSHFFAGLVAPQIAVTPKIQAQADQIVAGVSGHKAQAQKLYEWVSQHIRYVGVEIGTGALIPHSADTVLANGYGDCKDHVALFSALLKARGIASEMVLINLGNDYSLPDIAVIGELNHAITWLPEFKLYADTTAGVAPFGVLPFSEYGKPVVHVVASGSAVRQIPVVAAEIATVSEKTTAQLDANDHEIGQNKTNATGPFSVALRQFGLAIQAAGPERIAAAYLQQTGIPGTASLIATPPTEFAPDYSLVSNFDIGPFTGINAGRRIAMPGEFAFLGVPGETLIGSFNNTHIKDSDPTPCYSGHAVEDIALDPPAGRRFLPPPADVNVKTANVSFTAHWALTGQTMNLHRELTAKFDTPLCSGAVRTETAKAITDIRNSFIQAVALAAPLPQAPPQATLPSEPFAPAVGFMPPSLSSDADAGKFLESEKDLSCEVNSIKVTIQINKTVADPKWASLAQVILNPTPRGAGQPDPEAQNAAFWITTGKGSLTSELVKHAGAAVVTEIPFSTPPAIGKPTQLFMTWKADGTVFANIDRHETYSLHLERPVTSLALIVSGAQVEFSDIQAGYSGAPDGKCTAPGKN